MQKIQTKNKIIIGIVIVIVILSILFYTLTKTQEKNDTKIKENNLTIPQNGKIYFYEKTGKSDIFAVGIIINDNQSLVFLWNKTANTTEIEKEYIPQTENETQAFKIIIEKGFFGNTSNKIVPCNLTKKSNYTYDFLYYDGWDCGCGHWSYGFATVYLNNQTIQYTGHVE